MQPNRVIAAIISRVKATPGLEYLIFELRAPNDVVVYGKYGWIESTVHIYRHGKDMCHIRGRNYSIDDSVARIIELARAETMPSCALNQFYKEHFPSLAGEVDFVHYHDYREPIQIACETGIWPPQLDRLSHFDWLAYERKVRTAVQGHPMPIPIKDAIIDVVRFK